MEGDKISYQWLLSFGCTGSLSWCTGSRAQGLSSCHMWAWLPCSMWDISSWTRDQTHILCNGRLILNHWTAREVPHWLLLQLEGIEGEKDVTFHLFLSAEFLQSLTIYKIRIYYFNNFNKSVQTR